MVLNRSSFNSSEAEDLAEAPVLAQRVAPGARVESLCCRLTTILEHTTDESGNLLGSRHGFDYVSQKVLARKAAEELIIECDNRLVAAWIALAPSAAEELPVDAP